MADDTAHKHRPKADPVEPTHVVTPTKAHNQSEPAAAPLETHTEAGGEKEPLVPRSKPADTYQVDSNGEVRAGPGDAGAQDEPRVLQDPDYSTERSKKRLITGIALGLIVLALIFMFFG